MFHLLEETVCCAIDLRIREWWTCEEKLVINIAKFRPHDAAAE
jgi:hypothetical protein